MWDVARVIWHRSQPEATGRLKTGDYESAQCKADNGGGGARDRRCESNDDALRRIIGNFCCLKNSQMLQL